MRAHHFNHHITHGDIVTYICNLSVEYRREHHPQCSSSSSSCMTYARVCVRSFTTGSLFSLCVPI